MSQARAARARDLAEKFQAAREPLLFFAEVAQFQANLVASQVEWLDLTGLLPRVLELISRAGTDAMKRAVEDLQQDRFQSLLLDYWQGHGTDGLSALAARVLLQPFAHGHAPGQGATPNVNPASDAAQACPRCHHAPQAGILRGVGHGRALSLICSLCLHEWPCPRNVCTSCGRERREALVYYTAEGLPARSLQSCTACRSYIQLIDLEEEPAAVADADEIAGLVLDVWAAEQGLVKQQQNLAGI